MFEDGERRFNYRDLAFSAMEMGGKVEERERNLEWERKLVQAVQVGSEGIWRVVAYGGVPQWRIRPSKIIGTLYHRCCVDIDESYNDLCLRFRIWWSLDILLHLLRHPITLPTPQFLRIKIIFINQHKFFRDILSSLICISITFLECHLM